MSLFRISTKFIYRIRNKIRGALVRNSALPRFAKANREREKFHVVLLYIRGTHNALFAIAKEILLFFEKISCAVLL